jgi:hypothetical protein
MSELDAGRRFIKYAITDFIRQHPNTTTRDVALHFRDCFRSKLYGSHRGAATIIAELRAAGVIEDVSRCPCCGRATTRGRRNGPLRIVGSC